MTKKTKQDQCAFADYAGICTRKNSIYAGSTCCHCDSFTLAAGEDAAQDGVSVPAQRTMRGPRYVKTMMIATCLLEKHPDAAAFGADADDRTALASSVAEIGLLDPLSVIEDGEHYMVLDGCGRLDSLRAVGADEALCMVFDLVGMSPRDFAMNRNTMQRKVTTGQRLMCYLSVNRSAVLEAAADNGGVVSKELRSRDRSSREYTSRDVAKRLGISDKDVRAGVELLKTEAECADADAPEGAAVAVREVYDRVMRGDTPIRRWRPAWEGIMKTKGGERAPIDYSALAVRTLVSLRTVFANWQEIPVAGHPEMLKALLDVLSTAPESAESALFAAGQALKDARMAKVKRNRVGGEL